jgi:cytochrome c oxidase assembly protein subunit 11
MFQRSVRRTVCQTGACLRNRTLSSGRSAHRPGRSGDNNQENMKVAYYCAAVAMMVFGVSYASVPLYKVFCQMTGFGGTTQVADEKKAKMVKPVEGADILKVYFMASVHSAMPWKFKPTQSEVKVVPGETALAFYTVKNTAKHPVTGVATYNVHPPKAGLYFNKIQCFCFEEQRLGPGEEIDMPVFFFIDPEIIDDPAMENVHHITLSYTFFKTGEELPEKDIAKTKESSSSQKAKSVDKLVVTSKQ